MGLAIDGNVVHGIARGGQAFINIENTNTNKDGSININGKNYYPFSENPSGNYRIKGIQQDGGVELTTSNLDIHFTISKDGKLTVTQAKGGSGVIYPEYLNIEKQPL